VKLGHFARNEKTAHAHSQFVLKLIMKRYNWHVSWNKPPVGERRMLSELAWKGRFLKGYVDSAYEIVVTWV
jgi:hypothetical protein